jgi:spermidine synthase
MGPLPGAVAAALVFLAAGSVLVLEILAVRLLAPYVGLTLETTTSIIGAALAGIAAGAAIGGRLADVTNTRRLVVALLVLGGLLALLTVPLVRWLGPEARGGGDLAAVAVTLVALVPPAAVLSAVSPAVARLQLRDLAASGTVVGRLSAWATAGALVGTFGSGFVLVPLMPVSAAVLAVGGLSIAAGLALGLGSRMLSPGVAAIAVAVALAVGALSAAADSPCDAETDYHCASIREDGQSGRELVLDDVRHSYVDLADPTHLEYAYTRWMADAIDAASRGPLDAVFVGGGGFTMPRWLIAERPGSTAEVLEVDGDLVELARERLGLRPSPDLRVTVGDARMSLRDRPDASADLVVGDAFGNLAVPWHLATAEWTEEVRRVLRPGGIYTLNVIDHPPLGLLKAEAVTLLDAFEDVRLIARPGPAGGNAVFVASDRRLPPTVRSSFDGATTYDRRAVERLAAGAEPLTDDDAPVDQLLTTRSS